MRSQSQYLDFRRSKGSVSQIETKIFIDALIEFDRIIQIFENVEIIYNVATGNYGSGMQGFDVHMTFTRGANDTIVIKSPSNATTSSGGAGTGFGAQGCFITGAPHPVGGDSPVQIDTAILMRDLSIVVTDSEAVYP